MESQLIRKNQFVLLSMDKRAIKVWLQMYINFLVFLFVFNEGDSPLRLTRDKMLLIVNIDPSPKWRPKILNEVKLKTYTSTRKSTFTLETCKVSAYLV